MFERLVLEIGQAGLSWLTMLKKRAAYGAAFADWDVDQVAAFGSDEEARLMTNTGIVRNRRKIQAVIENARRLIAVRNSHGGFDAWLHAHRPRPLPDWVKLFRATFVFTGPEVVREFLVSTSHLPGAHDPRCPVAERIAAAHPFWLHDL